MPTERDLRFAWRESVQQRLDEQAQKVRESLNAAWIEWAHAKGEASDYANTVAHQCVHPLGHAYEVSNLLLNGTLKRLLERWPQLATLFLHNVDSLGAHVDPGLLGLFLASDTGLGFEVMPRHFEDRGGGLARVDGRLRLVEGLALPREEDEFRLTYYNSMTTWIDIGRLLALFGLERADLDQPQTVRTAVNRLMDTLPTYVTLKDVKERWGRGHEDVFPVAQSEKLWGDMTALDGIRCSYFTVPRVRGQQLKQPAQLDTWLRDGSAEYASALCLWDSPSLHS